MKQIRLIALLVLLLAPVFSGQMHAQEELLYTTYIVKEGESLKMIASKIGCRVKDIKNLNPDVEKYPEKNTTLIVPKTKKYQGQLLTEKKPDKKKKKDKEEKPVTRKTYKVKKGDTLYSLAHKYNVTIQSLIDLNPDIKDGLKVGQTIVIPDKSDFTLNGKKNGTPHHLTMYKVSKGETKWSIAKAHGIKVEELEKINPGISGGLKEGDNIWVPVPEQEKTDGQKLQTEYIENAVIYHKVKPDDTLFKIAVMYGVEMSKIQELNPEATKTMRPGMLLKIPAKKKNNFIEHTVRKGETLYSICRFFEIKEEELHRDNPALKDGLKTGMTLLIRLPGLAPADQPETTRPENFFPYDTTRFLHPVRISFLLPLMHRDTNAVLTPKQQKIQDIALSFYMGAELALDSLRRAGIPVTAHVFDTQNSLYSIGKIRQLPDFKNSDISIGPFFFDKAQALAEGENELPVITPFYSKKQTNDTHPNIVKSTPDTWVNISKLTNYILTTGNKNKYIIISDDTPANNRIAKLIGDRLKEKDSTGVVQYLYPSHNRKDENLIYMDKEAMENSINEKAGNRVILVSDRNIIISDIVNTYGVLAIHHDVRLFTLKPFKNDEHLDYKHLGTLHWTFVSDGFPETESTGIERFRKKFFEKNHCFPDMVAFKGFDLTMDMVQRLSAFPETEKALSAGPSRRLAHDFVYTSTPAGDYRNTGLRLIRFNEDLEYELLTEN